MNSIGNLTQLICTLLYVMTIHAYVYTVACTFNSRLLSRQLGVVAGTLRGFFFPVRYCSVDMQLTRLRALCEGNLTSECVWKNLNSTALQVTCTTQQSLRFFFIRVFEGVLSSEFVDYKQKKRTVTSKKHVSRPTNLLLCLLQP